MPKSDAIRYSPFAIRKANGPLRSRSEASQKRNGGFTLIEILLALLMIFAILVIFFTTSSTYVSSRGTNLQGTASKIASCEIEQLRNTNFSSLSNGTVDVPSPCNQDLSKLPPGSTAKRTLSNYSGNTDIKLATIQVNWVDNKANKNIKMETLIYEYGL